MQIGCVSPSTTIFYPEINSEDRSDADLIASIAAGDKLAMRLLFARHSIGAHPFAVRLTGNASIAEDFVVEVFFDVWRQASSFEARCQLSLWLLSTARRKAVSYGGRRSGARWDEELVSTAADSAGNPEPMTDRTGRGGILQRYLTQLSPEQRTDIDLVYYRERSAEEAAAILNAPDRTIKTATLRARKRPAQLLATKGIHTMRQ